MNTITLQKCTDLYEQITDFTNKFPKPLRYTLGQKIDNLLLHTIQNIIQAEIDYSIKKDAALNSALINTETLKILIRLAVNKKILKETVYFSFASNLIEIQKMLNGWRKSLAK